MKTRLSIIIILSLAICLQNLWFASGKTTIEPGVISNGDNGVAGFKDSVIHSAGASVMVVGETSDLVKPVVWENLTNVSATGNTLKKTGGCDGCPDAGATSEQFLAEGDGYLEFTATDAGTIRYIGLSGSNADTNFNNIAYSIKLTDSRKIEIRELNKYKTQASYQKNDVFKVSVEKGVVKYYKNGYVFYISKTQPTYPLYVDTALLIRGGTINNVMFKASNSNMPALTITNVSGAPLSTTSAQITWATNLPATSRVEYGTTTAYGNFSPAGTAKTNNHSVTLTGLNPNTVYQFRVLSTASSGGSATSQNFTFTTPAPADTTAPLISGLTVANLTHNSATINWTTNENSNSTVDYGLSQAYSSSVTVNTLVTSHSLTLTGLTPSTLYNFRVKSQDNSNNLATSANSTFTTPAAPDTTAPSIINLKVTSITLDSATINWLTDENSDSQVDYGLTTSYGNTRGASQLVANHSIMLTGLSENTLYNFRVTSGDASGNQAVSGNLTFTTLKSPGIEVITDYNVHPAPPPPLLPAAGGTIPDQTFGTTIMRLTDSGDGNDCYNRYSYWPSFNKDSTYIWATCDNKAILYTFNPTTFKIVSKRQLFLQLPAGVSPITEDMIWSSIDPQILYFQDGTRLWSYHVGKIEYTLIKDFRTPLPSSNLWQMSKSDDDQVFAFTRKNSNYNNLGYIVWQRETDTIIRRDTSSLDEVQVDKTGRWVMVKTGDSGRSAIEGQVHDLLTGSIENLTDNGPDYNPGHSDNGRGIVIGHDNWQNRELRRDFASPHSYFSIFDWLDWNQDSHLSLLAENEDWILVSAFGPYGSSMDWGPFWNEIFQVATDGSKRVRRLAHHQSYVADYYDSPRANISRDGRFAVFTSNWGGSKRDVFILSIPQTN